MSAWARRILEAVASITASLFLASCGAAIAGVYVAIWGDNAFGGRIIATGLNNAAERCRERARDLHVVLAASEPKAEAS